TSILSILELLPNCATVFFYLDSLATIQNLNGIIFPSWKFSNQRLKRPNHRLWSAIEHLISSKHLTVTLNKVKGHSGDILNDRSDYLAKAGATSSAVFVPNNTNFSSLPFPLYFNSLNIDNNIRSFVANLADANSFLEFLSLDHLSCYLDLSHLVDWPASWSFASFSLYVSKLQTNFRDDKFQSFRRKLLFDDLPTMKVLSQRNPSLYDPSWNCFHCNLVTETCSHLWFCQPSDTSKWSRLEAYRMTVDLARDSLKLHLQKEIKKLSILPSPDWFAQFSRLHCWALPTSNSSLYSF